MKVIVMATRNVLILQSLKNTQCHLKFFWYQLYFQKEKKYLFSKRKTITLFHELENNKIIIQYLYLYTSNLKNQVYNLNKFVYQIIFSYYYRQYYKWHYG